MSELQLLHPISNPCGLLGHLVVLKKNGTDGPKFPIKQTCTLIGRYGTTQHARCKLSICTQFIMMDSPVSCLTVICMSTVYVCVSDI
jgi:hypothetical protein